MDTAGVQGREDAAFGGEGTILTPGLNEVLRFRVFGRPVPWARMRGREHRYKPEDLKAWQEHVAIVAREEASLADLALPITERCVLWMGVVAKGEKFDLDNVAKGIVDALSGVLYPDDRMKYVVGKMIFAYPEAEGEFVEIALLVPKALWRKWRLR